MLRRHMERFFLHFLLLRSQIGFISFFFDFSSFLLALRLWIHSRLICVCVCVWWVRYGSCRNLVNETNGKYIICSNCKPQNCAVFLPQTKLIGISNDRKQCPREQEIYGLVFGFFGVSVVVVVLLPAFVRVEICNGLVLQRGAWRLSVLLLLLFGTIYVSRFSLVDFRSLLSPPLIPFFLPFRALLTLRHPHKTHTRTTVPNVSCTHYSQQIDRAHTFSISICWLFVFQFFGHRLHAAKIE